MPEIETVELPPPLDVLSEVGARVYAIAAGIRSDQWALPTPCTAWDVRVLLNHVVQGNTRTAAAVAGEEPPDRISDLLGDDPAAALDGSVARLVELFLQPNKLGGTYDSPLGEMAGVALVELRINELQVHGWDLAVATGQPRDFPRGPAEEALRGLRSRVGDGPRDALPFDPPQSAADDAPAIDRLAAYLGRTVPTPS